MKNVKVSLFVVTSLLIHLSGGKDLYWKPNSNWGNPSNWKTGRVPECGERVSLQNVPEESVVYLDTDTTVASIALPENGQLLLGESVTIRLTPDTECTVSGASPPMAATVMNEFIGAATDYWECPHNWMDGEGSPVEHAPCADDNAIFDKGYFSFVGSNTSIYVQSVTVRGSSVKSSTELDTGEFKLKLEVNPKCGDDPSLCPCPDDSQCPKVVTDAKPQSNVGIQTGGVVAGVLIPIILILIAVLVVIAIIAVYKCRMKISYVKDRLVEENVDEGASNDGKGVYDNPLFSDEVKVDLSAPAEDVPVDKGVSFEYGIKDATNDGEPDEGDEPFENGEDFDKKSKGKKKKKAKEAKLNEYERF